eukprot:3997143-Pyramimonas_sp.AAC.1
MSFKQSSLVLNSLHEEACAVMLVHRIAIYTQPLVAAFRAYSIATLTYWTPTCTIWLAGFPRASALRLRRAVRFPVPACIKHGDIAVAP